MRSGVGLRVVLLLLWSGVVAGGGTASAGDLLLSVSPGGGQRPPDPLLRKVDSADGSTVSGESVSITLAGYTVIGGSGLARHPDSQILFALVKVENSSFRRLVTLDEETGIATDIGDTGNRFAGMAFASDGTLYAVTGDGGGVPETLFTLSTLDGSPTQVLELGAGSDGETLGFNPDDGLLYHASGIGTPNHPNGEKFETVNLTTWSVTNVPLSGFDYEELTALGFADGAFFAGDLGNSAFDMPRLLRISTTGVVTLIGSMDHVAKGLVPVAVPVAHVPSLGMSTLALLVAVLMLAGAAGTLGRAGRLRPARGAPAASPTSPDSTVH